jgi:hypothetical protein
MLDKRIIYTKCMYNCLYHVSSVGKAVSLLEASRLIVIQLFQLTRHDTKVVHTQCVFIMRGRRGHDCMVIRFTTTCAISAYHQ